MKKEEQTGRKEVDQAKQETRSVRMLESHSLILNDHNKDTLSFLVYSPKQFYEQFRESDS